MSDNTTGTSTDSAWTKVHRGETLAANGRRFVVTSAIVCALTLSAWASATRAQLSSLEPPAPKSTYAVSVRDLQIPRKAQEAFRRGSELLFKHDPAGSLSHFSKALQNYPNFYEAYYNRGVAQLQLHQHSEALESFQRAIDLSGGCYPRASFGYALVLARVGRVQDAETIVRRGLEQDSTIPDGHVVLSVVLSKLHRLEEAKSSAREALLIRGLGSSQAYLALASIHDELEDYQAEVQDLETYLKLELTTPYKQDLLTELGVARRLVANTVNSSKNKKDH